MGSSERCLTRVHALRLMCLYNVFFAEDNSPVIAARTGPASSVDPAPCPSMWIASWVWPDRATPHVECRRLAVQPGATSPQPACTAEVVCELVCYRKRVHEWISRYSPSAVPSRPTSKHTPSPHRRASAPRRASTLPRARRREPRAAARASRPCA